MEGWGSSGAASPSDKRLLGTSLCPSPALGGQSREMGCADSGSFQLTLQRRFSGAAEPEPWGPGVWGVEVGGVPSSFLLCPEAFAPLPFVVS